MVKAWVRSGVVVALWAVAVAPAQAASGDDSHFCAAADRARAIVSCTRIIEDKGQSEAAQELALRNRAFSYQAVGDFDHAIGGRTEVAVVAAGGLGRRRGDRP